MPTKFHGLIGLVEAAVKSGDEARADVRGLWEATKRIVGRDISFWHPVEGFARIAYSGDPLGPSFQEDVARFEKLFGARAGS